MGSSVRQIQRPNIPVFALFACFVVSSSLSYIRPDLNESRDLRSFVVENLFGQPLIRNMQKTEDIFPPEADLPEAENLCFACLFEPLRGCILFG